MGNSLSSFGCSVINRSWRRCWRSETLHHFVVVVVVHQILPPMVAVVVVVMVVAVTASGATGAVRVLRIWTDCRSDFLPILKILWCTNNLQKQILNDQKIISIDLESAESLKSSNLPNYPQFDPVTISILFNVCLNLITLHATCKMNRHQKRTTQVIFDINKTEYDQSRYDFWSERHRYPARPDIRNLDSSSMCQFHAQIIVLQLKRQFLYRDD